MAKINLRDYYPFYNTDLFIEIPDEVNAALLEAERSERNYIRRRFYNKAHGSWYLLKSDGSRIQLKGNYLDYAGIENGEFYHNIKIK